MSDALPVSFRLPEQSLFIGGAWIASGSGRRFPVRNPATGQIIAWVADADASDARRAADAAYAAFPAWSRLPAARRGQLLRNAAALMHERREELARLITLEMGKPWREAKGEVAYAASFFEWFAGEGERAYGDVIPHAVPGKRHVVLKQPVGVVAAITPWNFPAAMIARKLAPALAAGCTVVLKPAEQTPLTAMALMEILAAAGVPDGVVNLVTTNDPAAVADAWLHDERVRKITFTGSTEVGKLLMRKAADQVKRVSLELGGHAPVIVFDDADIDRAVRGTLASKFRNSGQTCVCANRIYVQEPVYEAFAAKFTEAVKRLRVGGGFDESIDVGPLVDEAALAKVAAHVDDALAKGARLLAGGRRLEEGELARGFFFAPTVLADVSDDMRVMCEETFGPVAPLVKFRHEAEAYERANASRYGLAAYVFTENIHRAWRAAERLEYGIIGLNDGTPSTAQVPFGGFKESGIGREGGPYGIHEFLEVKLIGLAVDEEPPDLPAAPPRLPAAPPNR
ncbi:MAG: NAD-dependent succinate-semialdehyde dehydrogenase [Bacillota bacterium]|nr:succinate-semialdehyde dehydrogenase (NADP(+)) [Bacillota bacterium]